MQTAFADADKGGHARYRPHLSGHCLHGSAQTLQARAAARRGERMQKVRQQRRHRLPCLYPGKPLPQ